MMCAAWLLALSATPAAAQDTASAAGASDKAAPALEEIVVTAAKRTSTIQQTAGSITAVGGDEVAARGFTSFSDLAATVPALSSTTSGPGQTEYELRGVSGANGGGNSPTVGFYLDDTPLSPDARTNSGHVVIDPSLYDIDRVEVLRGPQGTLYGSGSMGGTIKIVTNQPNLTSFDTGADVKLSGTEGGGFNHTENGMVNLPLVQDKAALRIVGTYQSTSGWIDRIVPLSGTFPNPNGNIRGDVAAAPVAADHKGVNSAEETTVRAEVLVQPVDNLSITPSIFYQHVEQGGPSAFDTDPGTLAHYQPYDLAEPYDERFMLENLNVQYHLSAADLTSNSAYFSRHQVITQDASENIASAFGLPSEYLFGPVAFVDHDNLTQFSQEIRAVSAGKSPLKWLIGAFYSDGSSSHTNLSIVPGMVPVFGTSELLYGYRPFSIKQGAIFGELSYQIIPSLKATVGLRGFHYDTTFTDYEAGIAGPTGDDTITTSHGEAKANGVNPKYDLTYTPTEDLTVYGTVAKGFRPGGGNQAVPTGATGVGAHCARNLAELGLNGAPTQYNPDSLWSYEMGEKARFLDRRLSVNASVYDIEWKGIQQGVTLGCGFGFTANAGSAKILGSELEIRALVATDLEFNDSAGYIDARISQGSLAAGTATGDPLQTVPRWTNNVGLTYHHPLEGDLALLAHLENNFVAQRYNVAFLNLTPTSSYDITNLRVGVTSGRWTATVFADNLLNKRTTLSYLATQSAAIPQYNRALAGQPLTAGIDVNVRY